MGWGKASQLITNEINYSVAIFVHLNLQLKWLVSDIIQNEI